MPSDTEAESQWYFVLLSHCRFPDGREMFVCIHVFIDPEIQINGFSYTSPSLLSAMSCLGLLELCICDDCVGRLRSPLISMMLMISVPEGKARAPETDGTWPVCKPPCDLLGPPIQHVPNLLASCFPAHRMRFTG